MAAQPQPSLAAAVAPTQPVSTVTNAQVLEQDRANLRGANFAPMVGPQPETTLPAQTLAATNQRIQSALDANRAPAQIPGERGNYNMANTSSVDTQGNIATRLRQPDNIIEGGYGQFGGGRAAQFLASRRAPAAPGGMSNASEEVRLRTALTSDNPQERRAAREQMAARQALELDYGATQRAGMQLEGEQQRAAVAGLAAVQAAEARAAGQQLAADIAGQYGLQEAQARAQGAVGAAQVAAGSGANLRSMVQAEQEARRLAVAQEAFERGDTAAGERALGIPQPAQRRLTVDMTGNVIAVDGLPVSAEEAAAFKQAQGYYAAPMQ